MEKTIISEENLPIKKRQLSAEKIYANLATNYPISKEVIRYTKVTNNSIQPAFHDLINTNLSQLVPNIDIGYQMNLDANHLMNWIQTAKDYVEQINNEFQKKCEKKLQNVIKIEERMYRSKMLDMNKLNQLPEDIIRYIHGFLMPETRIVLLRARYPNLDANVMKLKVPELKRLFDNIRNKYYTNMMSNLYKHNRARCLPHGFYIRFTYNNKPACLDVINKFIGTCETAVSHTPQDYRYFQRKALRILRSLVYVAKHKQVLDKAYAPELEQPKPVKKQRKPRTKKSN
jgi:hypothetical protein